MRSKLKPLIQKYVFKNFSKYVFVNTSVPISETVGDVTPVFARIIGPETSHTVRGGQDGLFFILQMRNLSLERFSDLLKAPQWIPTRAGLEFWIDSCPALSHVTMMPPNQANCRVLKSTLKSRTLGTLARTHSSVQFSHSVMSDSSRPHGLQQARPPCPSPTPGVAQTHVHWVHDAIQPSHPLLPLFL